MLITILTYLDKADDERSYDVVAEQVASALRELGHETSIFGVHGDVGKVVSGLTEHRPDFVFNILEDFAVGSHFGPAGVTGILDLLQIPYTGAGPGEMYISQDKALAKKILAYEGIRFPDFAVFSKDDHLETGGNLRMPLFVKPLTSDSSIGIDAKALVHSTRAMMGQVLSIHRRLKDSALVEEYIEGREFYVAVMGNRRAVAFPPIEMDFSGLPEGSPRFMDSRAKWDKRSLRYKGTKAVVADLPGELRAKIQRVSLDACRALRVRDYGRVDLRLTHENEIFVLEVNANCYLEKTSEFVAAAAAEGIDFTTLIGRILDHALERYGKAVAVAKA